MTTPAKPGALLTLVEKLKACPAHDNSFSGELLLQTWASFQQADPEEGNEPSPAILAGLILYDEQFARLLNEAERARMTALARVAWERYQEKTNPPNKLGKIIAAALKEPT
jgi:hypothetical protein